MAARRRKTQGQKAQQGLVQEIRDRSRRRDSNDVKLWDARIQLAEREAEPRMAIYDENERAVFGDLFDSGERRGRGELKQYSMSVNKFLPVLASQRERILPRVPWHRLIPQKAQSPTEAAQMRTAEGSLNFVFRSERMAYRDKISQFLLQTECALGAVEVCYTPDEGENPERDKPDEVGEIVPDVDPETGEETYEVEGGDPLTTEDGDFVRRGGKLLIDQRDPLDYFTLRNVHWRHLRVDPEGTEDPESLGWIATRFVMRLDKALRNPIFAKADKELMGTAAKSLAQKSTKSIIRPPRPYEDQGPEGGSGDDFLRVMGWRIYDTEAREVVYKVDGMPEIAGKFAYPKWVGHSPLVFLRFHPRLGTFYPKTAVEDALPLIRAYSVFWGTLLNHLKRFKRKYGADPNAFEKPEEEAQLLDPDDGLVLRVRGGKNALWPLDDAYLDPAIYRMMSMAERDFFEIMGSASEYLGTAQSSSATQAALIDRRGVSREDEKRDMLRTQLEIVGDKMLANIQTNLPRELAIRIVGPDGRSWKKTVSRADIQGRFRSSIDIQEMERPNQRQEVQQLLSLFQLLGPDAFTSPAFTRKFFDRLSWPDPEIAQDFTELAELRMAMELQQGRKTNGNGAQKPGAESKAKGGRKPTGQGPEQGAGTEGRSQGRAQRQEFGTLLGAGSTPAAEEA